MKRFMIQLMFALSTLLSLSFANAEPVVAKMKYVEVSKNIKAAAGARVDSKTQTYVLTFGVQWLNFDSKIHGNGYDLNSTKVRIVSPKLAENCALIDSSVFPHSMLGTLEDPTRGGYFEIALRGPGCAEYVRYQYRYSFFVVEVEDVPPLTKGALVTPVLRIEIKDLPISFGPAIR